MLLFWHMKDIKPISSLRDTAKLLDDLKEEGMITITKNGFSSMVILSPEEFEHLVGKTSSLSKMKTSFEPHHFLKTNTHDPLTYLGQDFVRVKADPIFIHLGDVKKNLKAIKESLKKSEEEHVSITLFQELSLTGYTCGDLFLTEKLYSDCEDAIEELVEFSKNLHGYFIVGLPFYYNGSLFNAAAVIGKGKIWGIVPKTYIPNYREFYEARYFKKGSEEVNYVTFAGIKDIPFASKLIFKSTEIPLAFGIELCEDVWTADPPSTKMALNGANVIFNLSASNETVGKNSYRRDLIKMTSARLISGYVYCSTGRGESTSDVVYGGHSIISENGKILAENQLFEGNPVIADIDLGLVEEERKKMMTFEGERTLKEIILETSFQNFTDLRWEVHKNPFIPEGEINLSLVKEIMRMQVEGLRERMLSAHARQAYVGLSGGLDSTLAFLVAVETFKNLGWDLKDVHAITLPCFGTSQRTHDNAESLANLAGTSFKEINIKASVIQHLKDIDHPLDNHNVTYENAQARERTQVLMDIANENGGIMVGTGDLSELCLGWCTYNGDHMSMDGVNGSIPKTLVRYLVKGYAMMHPSLAAPLLDILDTPISPELLPPVKGQISQKTEDTIGPYDLHDFFLFYFLRYGFNPTKIFLLAHVAYCDTLSNETILHWEETFFKRFFRNQFKRNCAPDGVKVGSVAVSPRGDLRLPSEISEESYLAELEKISTKLSNNGKL